jgi:hypothetical protein
MNARSAAPARRPSLVAPALMAAVAAGFVGAALLGSLGARPAHAQSGDVWVCEDPNTGHKTYHNNATNARGCKKLDTDKNPISTVPATKAPAAKAAAPSSPSSFPKVDGGTQRERDTDRKRILQEELTTETKRCDDLKKAYNNGEPERQGDERNFAKYQERVQRMKEDIDRCTANINALKREVG